MFILYCICFFSVFILLRDVGCVYESEIILLVFCLVVVDVSFCFLAKDMYLGECLVIEVQICDRMAEILEFKGLIVDNVLMKSIVLLVGLFCFIEEVLQVEQDVQCMEFIKQWEQFDVEWWIIQVQGEWDVVVIQVDVEWQWVEIQVVGDVVVIWFQVEVQVEVNVNL